MNMNKEKSVSIIIPAKNEERGLSQILPQIKSLYPDYELIVVNDGSTDQTAKVAEDHGAKVVNHKYSKGNGAAIKSGARKALGDVIVFMDGDGQHNPHDIEKLLESIGAGYDMVVGARSRSGQANNFRALANKFYNWLASKMVGHKIPDLTSGFRSIKREILLSYLYLLPNGFSYPTTITMAFFRAGFDVGYVPIEARKREGESHIRYVKDGTKFLLIIFKIAALYSPLKIFIPASLTFFFTGIGYYLFTYATQGRFTNMGMLLLVASMLMFLLGLISEQITSLMYKNN